MEKLAGSEGIAQSREGDDVTLCDVLFGMSPGQPHRFLVVNVDQALRVVSSVRVGEDDLKAEAPFLQGRAFDSLFRDPDKRAAVDGHVAAALAGGFSETYVAFERDGRAVTTHLCFMPRFHGPARQRGFILLASDATEHRRALQSAEELHQRLSAILENAADAILMIDEEGRVEDVNASATRLFGWTREELVGGPLTVLMDGAYGQAHQGHIERYQRTGITGILNVGPRALPAVHKDGRPIPIELSVGETVIGGRPKFIGVCRDISQRLAKDRELSEVNEELRIRVAEMERLQVELERGRAESIELAAKAEAARARAEAANQAKSRFIAKISHELRTPLNGILAVTDLLAGRDLSGPDRELVEIVGRSGRDLRALLNEVLDLAKIEAGALTLEAASFDLEELVGSLSAIWSAAATAKGLTLTHRIEGEAPRLMGDSLRLRQVLSNLISNGLKFTEAGGVDLTVALTRPVEGYAHLVFTVADTGPGLDPQARAQLFQPFAQGSSDHAIRHAGAGLGLAICREIVDLMGGDIRAEATAEGGLAMVVEVELPLAPAAAAEAGASAAAPSAARLDDDMLLLVAEDHPVNRRVMGLLLDQAGLRHEFAEDGVAALEAAATGRFGLVLMDVQMPRMDGLAAARAIRALPGPAAGVPIVAVTAEALSAEDQALADAGIRAVLTKPVTAPELYSAIEGVLAEGSEPAAA